MRKIYLLRISCGLLFCLMLPSGSLIAEPHSQTRKLEEVEILAAKAIKQAILFSASNQNQLDTPGLTLSLLQFEDRLSIPITIDLLRVYLGSANAEAVDYVVSQLGLKILPQLRSSLQSFKECDFVREKSSDNLPCLSKVDYEIRLQNLIKLVETRHKVEYVP